MWLRPAALSHYRFIGIYGRSVERNVTSIIFLDGEIVVALILIIIAELDMCTNCAVLRWVLDAMH